MRNQTHSTRDLRSRAVACGGSKFDPRVELRNPVMFVVEVGAVVTLAFTIDPTLFGPANASRVYNRVVTIILALTVVFANYAEAVAEGRGRAQAASLRTRRTRRPSASIRTVKRTVTPAELCKGDVVVVETNDIIPGDGDVIEGVAYVNEAAITGESAPVLKEPGTDTRSSVTGGTQVTRDVSGCASRRRTPARPSWTA